MYIAIYVQCYYYSYSGIVSSGINHPTLFLLVSAKINGALFSVPVPLLSPGVLLLELPVESLLT